MAKNYETICEALRLTGEQKLLKLSNTFQEHQEWLKQAFEDARSQLLSQKGPRSTKPGRVRGASEKENVPAPRRGSRKRGAAAQTLETVAEEEHLDDEPKLEETGAEDVQDIDIVGDAGVAPVAKPKGKPPLPGKPQRGRAARKEEAGTGAAEAKPNMGGDAAEQEPASDSKAEAGASASAPPATAAPGRRATRRTARSEGAQAEAAVEGATAEAAAAPEAAQPARRTTRRTAANSGCEPERAAQPQRQIRRVAAAKAAAAIAVDAYADNIAASEADEAPAAAQPAAPGTADDSSPEEQPAAEEAAQEPAAEDAAPAAAAVEQEEPAKPTRGRQAKAAAQRETVDSKAAESVQAPVASPGWQQAEQADKSVSATPAQRRQHAAPPPRTTRRMAAAERAVAKPDVQAHRLELSDDDHEDDMDVSKHQAAEGISPPAAPEEPAEAEEADEKEATPPAVEDTPVAKRAAATAARPKRAAAAAAQRAIAATAVKRPRGRHMSGASVASVPGTTCRIRQVAAAEEEAKASPALAAADTVAAEAQAEPEQADQLPVSKDKGVLPEMPAQAPLQDPQASVSGAGEPTQSDTEQPAIPDTAIPQTETADADAGCDLAAPDSTKQTGARGVLEEEAAGEPDEAGVDPGVDEEDEDNVLDFQEAQDVFETPSQYPKSMTPGTSFGTVRQQPTAYKTGHEHLTGAQPSTGKPVFIPPQLKNGPLARAAAASAAVQQGAAQAAQPAGPEQAATPAQQAGVVGRLKQQYEERAVEDPRPAASQGNQEGQKESPPIEAGAAADEPSQPAAEDASAGPAEPAESSQAQKGVAGMGANLVSTVRSFLPFVSRSGDAQPQPAAGKKPVKVKALEAADAARRKEAQRAAERAAQRQQVEAQKAERAKRAHDAKAAQAEREEEARRLAQEALNRREEEAAARRHAKEEAEKKEREERQKRQEELRQKRKQAEQQKAAQEERARKAGYEEEERKRKAAKQQEAEAKRPRLQGPPAKEGPPASGNVPSQAAAMAAKQPEAERPGPSKPASSARPLAAESAADLASRPATAMPIHGMVKPSTPVAEIAKSGACPSAAAAAAASAAGQPGRPDSEQFQSYELSPYKSGSESSDSEEDAEKERKPIPKWARGQALTQALAAQMAVDPDEIFKLHQKTCPLNEVFEQKGASNKHPRKDLNRRTSSGNWIEDRVTWKEELNYKKAMGYL